MFGLGMGEIVIILVLALILLGPQKLPDAAKQLGKGLRELRKATEDLKQQFENEMQAIDLAPKPPAAKPGLAAPAPGAAPQPTAAGEPAVALPATAENVPGLEAALAEAPTALPAGSAPPPP